MRLLSPVLLGVALAACATSRIKVEVPKGDPLPVDAAAVYPVVFRWEEPAWRSFELSQLLAQQLADEERYAVFGPSEFKLIAPSNENPFVGSDLTLGLADRGLSPRSALVFRPWVEKRVQSAVKQLFDSNGKPKGLERVEEATLVVRMEVFHSSSRELVARLDATVELDPLATHEPSDPMPELTELLGELMKKAVAVIEDRAPGSVVERDPGFEYLFNPRVGFAFSMKGKPSFSEEVAKLDLLEQDLATEARVRFFLRKVDDATVGRVMRLPPGLYVTAVREGAGGGLQAGDVVLQVAGEPALPQSLRRALRTRQPGATVPLKVRRGSQELEIALPVS